MLIAVVNGQNCRTKFGNVKTSKLRQLCKKDASCKWSNDSGPGKKQNICVDRTDVEGVKDCSTIKSEVNCQPNRNPECEWKEVEGVSACRNICSQLSGSSYQSKRKKMCRKPHNSHCRWRKAGKVCYDIVDAPKVCDQILTPTHCRENDKCEWIKVNGQTRGCRDIVTASRCDDILDRQQCRMFTNNGKTCRWETFPTVRCYDDEHDGCSTIYEQGKCNEAFDRYGFRCYWNGRGEGIYEENDRMNSKEGLRVDRCNNFPACESMTSQGQCEANKNMIGGNCYWNPTFQGGAKKGESTAPYQCKEADCATFPDKYTCKHFGCYWARSFPGWENNKNNDKEDKKGIRTYKCQNP